jgi:glycosyltransferase involved in cell wall biosynthesis
VAVPWALNAAYSGKALNIKTFPAQYMDCFASSGTVPIIGPLALRRLRQQFKPDVIFFEEPEHLFMLSGLGVRTVAGSECLTVGMLHTNYEACFQVNFRGRKGSWITNKLFLSGMYRSARHVDVMITHCQALADSAARYGMKTVKVSTFHGVRQLFLDDAPPPLASRPRDVLFVGHLREEKRISIWLAAAAKVLAQYPDSQWTLAGDGQDGAYFHNVIRNANLPIRILDALTTDQVKREMDAHRIFLNCSDTEGFCTNNLEAMARGMVLLAANGGGNREQFVDGKSGLLFAAQSEEAAANTVCRVMNDLPFAQQIGVPSMG